MMLFPGDGTTDATAAPGTVTQLLRRWRSGDPAAADALTAIVYPELRQIARGRLALRRDGDLSPTELVHEAFLRLVQQRQPDWVNRSHFYFIAARLMRQILVDFSRERLTVKRGEGRKVLHLDRIDDLLPRQAASLLSLDEALIALAAFDDRKAQALEMRYFGGMTAEEIAQVLGVSGVTVARDLRAAKAWLRAHLAGEELPL
jgi:RNA polymerase sigma factor (TIGR02999 family)